MSVIPVERVNEIVLEVLDLDEAVRFYHEKLGLKLHARREDRAWLIAGQSRIGLWTPQVGLAKGRGGVHVHYAFHLPDEHFDATVERLDEAGLEPEVISFEDEGRGRAVYVTDPDGNVVEFWTWDVAGDA
jgi:catechol 2,3-dioxygenase-like lactoylglutathione lyase family enzyme